MENEEYDTIDLLEVLNAVRQHLAILILCTLAAAVVGFTVSKLAMTPQYESSALMIVNTRQDTTSNVTRSTRQPNWFLPTASLSKAILCCSRLSMTSDFL